MGYDSPFNGESWPRDGFKKKPETSCNLLHNLDNELSQRLILITHVVTEITVTLKFKDDLSKEKRRKKKGNQSKTKF